MLGRETLDEKALTPTVVIDGALVEGGKLRVTGSHQRPSGTFRVQLADRDGQTMPLYSRFSGQFSDEVWTVFTDHAEHVMEVGTSGFDPRRGVWSHATSPPSEPRAWLEVLVAADVKVRLFSVGIPVEVRGQLAGFTCDDAPRVALDARADKIDIDSVSTVSGSLTAALVVFSDCKKVKADVRADQRGSWIRGYGNEELRLRTDVPASHIKLLDSGSQRIEPLGPEQGFDR